jgi:hypothetical protein
MIHDASTDDWEGHQRAQAAAFDANRSVGNKRIINAGSVGIPYADQPGAYWAFFHERGVTLERTPYDVEAAARAFSTSGCPHAEQFAQDIRSPRSATDATEFFEKRATG